MFYVYGWFTPEGECFYVGKGSGNRSGHLKDRNRYFLRIYEAHPICKPLILHPNLTEEQAFALEVKEIAERKPRANLAPGGRGGMSGLKLDDNWKRKIGDAHRGMVRPVGTGEKIAASKRGKPRSEETKEKIRQSLLGRKHSDETKEAMRKAHAGRSTGGSGRVTGNH